MLFTQRHAVTMIFAVAAHDARRHQNEQIELHVEHPTQVATA